MSTTTENKINYGLKNCYYAKVTNTDGTITYGTPVALPGAINISLKKNFERTPVAADDDPEYAVVTENKGYEGDLELTNIPQSFYTDCLGMTVDGSTIIEKDSDRPSYFALLFEFDGDVKKRRHVLYNCLATPNDIESGTKGDKAEAKTKKITITATKAKDTGIIKRSTTTNDGTVYESWFTEVQTSGGVAA